MRHIIIGASGVIGSQLFAAAKNAGHPVVGTCHNHRAGGLVPFDMRREQLTSVIQGIGPDDVVYLLSAYSNPSWIFAHQEEAAALNRHATRRLIDDLLPTGARVIFMSTMEVFDGEAEEYHEASAPNPLNFYGRMKYEIEQYLSQKKCPSCVVRTGWNVGWDPDSRCVISLTYKSLLQPGARMAKDNIFSIIDVRDTAEGLLRLSGRPDVTCCHLASTPALVRTGLASAIMDLSRYKDLMGFQEVPFSEIPYSERRSRYNRINNSFAVNDLGLTFRLPADIIREKVALLDRHFEALKPEETYLK